MKMNTDRLVKMNIDRLIGSITIATGVLIVSIVAIAMWQNEKDSFNTVYVLFSEIGALQKEDAVTIRGYKIGHVASITMATDSIIMSNDSLKKVSDTSAVARKKLRDAMALVKIALYEPFSFSKDTKFKNISPSILGSRSIAIELGKSTQRIPKDYIFLGEFESGFAEVLALADVAKEQVANLMELVNLLHAGDAENTSLQYKVENILAECEEFIDVISEALNSVEKQAFGALGKIDDYVGQASDAGIEIKHTLDTIKVQAKDGIAYLEKMVLDVQDVVENLDKVLVEFENSPIKAVLLDEKNIMDDLNGLISTLQAFLGSVDGKGLKIYDEKGKRKSMVHLRNLHLIRETARSKAKKRAAEVGKN